MQPARQQCSLHKMCSHELGWNNLSQAAWHALNRTSPNKNKPKLMWPEQSPVLLEHIAECYVEESRINMLRKSDTFQCKNSDHNCLWAFWSNCRVQSIILYLAWEKNLKCFLCTSFHHWIKKTTLIWEIECSKSVIFSHFQPIVSRFIQNIWVLLGYLRIISQTNKHMLRNPVFNTSKIPISRYRLQ